MGKDNTIASRISGDADTEIIATAVRLSCEIPRGGGNIYLLIGRAKSKLDISDFPTRSTSAAYKMGSMTSFRNLLALARQSLRAFLQTMWPF